MARGKFAVMRHSQEAKRAHFSVLHDTYDAACAEAVRLLASSVSDMPDSQHHFYVLEVAARFSAGSAGLSSEAR